MFHVGTTRGRRGSVLWAGSIRSEMVVFAAFFQECAPSSTQPGSPGRAVSVKSGSVNFAAVSRRWFCTLV